MSETRREITLETLKGMTRGDAIHLPDGRRWRVNGAVKTWKRDAGRVRVPLKFGLYAYDAVTESDIDTLASAGAYIDRY
jgi:hypothetical protein